MSESDRLFKELGYEKKLNLNNKGVAWGETYISVNDFTEIIFDYQDREICIAETEGKEAVYIGMDELKAINERVKELRW